MELEDILLIVISGISIIMGIAGFVWGMRMAKKCRELAWENKKLLVRNLELEYGRSEHLENQESDEGRRD
jgi:hypothetical protein